MQILINIKSVSKTRGIEPIPYNVLDDITTLQDLIENLVDIEINKYESNELKVLSQTEIDNMLDSGKISFGFKYREDEEKVDRKKAKQAAIDAFNDGLYVVFINNQKIEELHNNINLKENDELSLVRLTMLAGRYF